MELFNKQYNELSSQEIYELFKLRIAVFVVEQKCPYQEVDETDLVSRHFFIKDNGIIIAYLRIYFDSSDTTVIHIGRVISTDRRKGIGSFIVSQAIKYIKEDVSVNKIEIEAQNYTKQLYSKLGFIQTSDVFLLDNIEHVRMELLLADN